MKTAGIISEYNPFHNGHAYQIEQIRQNTDAENIVVVMSGNFVQRGTPAFTDKYLRTRIAIECGADFVFELPALYATASSELFALGGVSLLNSLGFIDYICFGSECGDISILNNIANIFTVKSNEPDCTIYKLDAAISKYIKSGMSYPAARSKALLSCDYSQISPSQITDTISQPNNILAIEYLKALKYINSNIQPYTIKRCDNGYNNHDFNISTQNKENKYISASAIRNAFLHKSTPFDLLKPFFPSPAINILQDNNSRINISIDEISPMLYYKIRSILSNNTASETDSLNKSAILLTKYLDVSKEISYRILNNLSQFETFTQFAHIIKTKQYTYSRICRALIHILLNIYTDDILIQFPIKRNTILNPNQITPYARLLGMRKEKSYLLKSVIKQNNPPALITKVANAYKVIDKSAVDNKNFNAAFAKKLFDKDIFAADLYHQIQQKASLSKPSIPDEYRAGVVIL